ncbi:hypothetical protein CDO23_00510 [Sinorhizobium meliloti]|nr:hypothetical protein CDO23_00510 [Sinorhizobium meliloti]
MPLSAPHPPAGTFSPQAGRRDKRRQLNPAFTVRPRERAGAAYPFSPPAGRRWRQPVEGQSRPSGVEAVGSPRDPFHEQYPPHRRDKRQTHQSPLPACGGLRG